MNIHEGDSKDKVVALFGVPDQIMPSSKLAGATAYYYQKKQDICGFTIKEDVVKYYMCTVDANYVSPLAAMGTVLKGAGDGLKSSNSNQATCTTSGTNNGGYYNGTTNCH